MGEFLEHRDLHPRAAQWIASRREIYLHEYRILNYGIADFLVIHPGTGQLSVMECKVSEQSEGNAVSQLERYSTAFQELNIKRYALYLLPVSMSQRAYCSENNVSTFVLGMDYSPRQLLRQRDTLEAFDKAFKQFYGCTLYQHLMKFQSKRDRQAELKRRRKAKAFVLTQLYRVDVDQLDGMIDDTTALEARKEILNHYRKEFQNREDVS